MIDVNVNPSGMDNDSKIIVAPVYPEDDIAGHPLRAVGALGSILVLAISAGTALYQFVT